MYIQLNQNHTTQRILLVWKSIVGKCNTEILLIMYYSMFGLYCNRVINFDMYSISFLRSIFNKFLQKYVHLIYMTYCVLFNLEVNFWLSMYFNFLEIFFLVCIGFESYLFVILKIHPKFAFGSLNVNFSITNFYLPEGCSYYFAYTTLRSFLANSQNQHKFYQRELIRKRTWFLRRWSACIKITGLTLPYLLPTQ